MLELGQVVAQIAEMGAEVRQRTDRLADQMAVALAQARAGSENWAEARKRIESGSSAVPWQVAIVGDEPPTATRRLPYPAPLEYSALATDGSHIPLDRHAIAPCYLLNVGLIALHYGTGERPHMQSQATLHYKEAEIYAGNASGEAVPLSERMVANKRLLAESASLAALVAVCHERHAVALVDDPLVVWTPTGESDEAQAKVIHDFCEMLNAAEQCGVPIAGYISRPGHRDVIGALRILLCREACTHGVNSPCRQIAHLSDAQLFDKMLSGPGDRSPVFGSDAPNLKHYPAGQKIHFFYLHVGDEVARVEIPVWVANNVELLDRVHVLLYDQAVKGLGYPIALSEAHERAIVRGPERDAFFRLVEQTLIRQDLPVLQTRKAVSKRKPIV